MRRAVLSLLVMFATWPLLGCGGGSVTTSCTAGETTTLLFGRAYWFQQPGGIRFHAGMLVRDLFAQVPLMAVITVDGSNRLEFVGLSDWGMRLAQASVTLDDPAPVQLSPSLARIPRLGPRLSLALKRVFLVWPWIGKEDESRGGHTFDNPETTNGLARYAVDRNTMHLTGKRGSDQRGAWCVSMYYSTTASPETAPEKIVYRGDGLEILFKLKVLSKDE